MKFTHHLDPKTFNLLLKTSKSGEDPSVSCFPGVQTQSCGGWQRALPSSSEVGLRKASGPRCTASLHTAAVSTGGSQEQKASPLQEATTVPSHNFLELSLAPTWHNDLAVPVATSKYMPKRLSPPPLAKHWPVSEREER